MNKIKNNILKQELKYEDTVILTYTIEYPEIIFSEYLYSKEIFNIYNKNKALSLQKYCKQELYKEAIETYKYNKENGYPIMVYEVVSKYDNTYNNKEIVSLYNDTYTFTGGAHGNTIRTSQNWNLKLGKQIALSTIYPNNPYYIVEILLQINRQIAEKLKENETEFFENYCELTLENFRLENYYITQEHIEIYYQQYDIAPYSSGIPTFKIEKFQLKK